MLRKIYNAINGTKSIKKEAKDLQSENSFVYDQQERFNNILNFAKSVIETTTNIPYEKNKYIEHPVINVIRLLGREIQTKYLIQLVSSSNDSQLENITPDLLFFGMSKVISENGRKFSHMKRKIESNKEICLSKDLILPWCWKRERLAWCFSNIGEGKFRGAWKQDFSNHDVDLWLPMGIAWVKSGNHSISTGIIQGEGKIMPEHIYDISDVYNYVKCDGLNYIRIEDNSIIAPVSNVEFAAIFEIGRLMKDNSISF